MSAAEQDQNIKKFIVIDDLVLELKYERSNFSMPSVPVSNSVVYIANLHHGHSKISSYWGNKIKSKKMNKSEKGLGVKLLAWSVKNFSKIFEGVPTPEYWCGQFETGYRYWSKTSLWNKLENEMYITHQNIVDWANKELEDSGNETGTFENVAVHNNSNFLSGGKRVKNNNKTKSRKVKVVKKKKKTRNIKNKKTEKR